MSAWRCVYRTLCGIVLGFAIQTPAWSAPPTLSHLFPAGGERGKTVAVTAHGSFTWPVIADAPGAEIKVLPESGKLEVTIPADLASDRIWIRLYNAEGTAVPFPFLVGQLPELNEVEPNNGLKVAQKLPSSKVVINGILEGADVDAFAVELKKGETLVAAVEANTALGSPMDAMLQVVTPSGTVLADNNDDIHLDPRLGYTAESDGVHIVRLFAFSSAPNTNINYAGGANFVYRLTLTTGPYIAHGIPLAVSRQELSVGSFAIATAGWNLPADLRVPIVPIGGNSNRLSEFEPIDELRRPGFHQIGLVWMPGVAGTARVQIAEHASISPLAQGTRERPTPLSLGQSATGWIRKKGQRDVYGVALTKGQVGIFTLESRTLNLLLDPVLILLDPAGNKIAEVDDVGPHHDCVVSATAGMDGTYRLIVADRYSQFGDRYVYRLTARTEVTDFELNLPAEGVTIDPEKPAELVVKVVRRQGTAGAIGNISVQATNLPEGLTCDPVVSESAGATAGEVKLLVKNVGKAFQGPIQIVGTTNQPSELRRFARTPPRLGVCREEMWLTALEKPPAK